MTAEDMGLDLAIDVSIGAVDLSDEAMEARSRPYSLVLVANLTCQCQLFYGECVVMVRGRCDTGGAAGRVIDEFVRKIKKYDGLVGEEIGGGHRDGGEGGDDDGERCGH